jgi:cystathionine beta-lyase/cystathionine gamma-synthase
LAITSLSYSSPLLDLIIPEFAGLQLSDFDAANREHRYIRMYVGLEEPDYLSKDLEQALGRI